VFVPRRFRLTVTPSLLALVLVAAPTPSAFAAGARLERPGTDGAPTAPAVLPQPPFVFTPAGGPRVLDLANPMREITPGVYEGIVPVRLPDGSWQVDLDERFMQFSVARRGESGVLARGCVGGLMGLARWQAEAPVCGHGHVAARPTAATAATTPTAQPRVTTPSGTVAAKWEVR